MQGKRGSALVDYIIPTAIIGVLLGLCLYQMVSSNNILTFLGASGDMKVDVNDNIAFVGDEDYSKNPSWCTDAGCFNGTPEEPVKRCENGLCTIDFGEFILNGLPENFNEFVETVGTSSGTDKICSMLEQIADQLELNGDVDGAKDFRNLANLEHFVADMQGEMDQQAKTCSTAPDPMACMQSYLGSTSPASEVPSNLDGVLTSFYTGEYLANISAYCGLGYSRYYNEVKFPSAEPSTSRPSGAASIIFDKILNDSSYSDSLKNVTIALMQNVDDIAVNQQKMISGIQSPLGYGTDIVNKYNILNGQLIETVTPTPPATIDGFYHPQTSVATDLTSTLICVSGKNTSESMACY
ncbi:MAG: hypothetical protein AB1782_09205 [Cyanobacteriota bacterium]